MNSQDWQKLTQVVESVEPLSEAERTKVISRAFPDNTAHREMAHAMVVELRRNNTCIRERLQEYAGSIDSSPALSAGDIVAGFEIRRLIGKGGMGEVYLGHRKTEHFELYAAVKIIYADFATGLDTLPDAKELQSLAALSHPNIARFIDGGLHPDLGLYLVSEFVDGVPLVEWCSTPSRTEKEKLAMFVALCAAVQHAHSRLLIHCDIKPANILVDKENHPKLLDFGIASAAGTSDKVDRSGSRYTPAYASPEQTAGDALTISTDIYSLGAVLFEVLTGRKLSEESLSGNEQARKPQNPKINYELAAIVSRSTLRCVTHRYATAHDLAADVQRFIDEKPVTALTSKRHYRILKFLQRHTIPTALTLCLVVVAFVFLTSYALQQERIRSERNAMLVERFAKESTTEFLAATLGKFDPIDSNRALIDVPTEVLLDIASRANTSLQNVPTAQLTILRDVADSLHSKGIYAEAESTIAQAISVSERVQLLNPLTMSSLYRVSGLIQGSLGNAVAADADFAVAEAALDRTGSVNTVHHARLALALGAAARSAGDYERSEDYLSSAITMFRLSVGEDSAEVARALDQLGYLYLFLDRSIDALPFFVEARDITARVLGREHANYGRQTAHLATAYRNTGQEQVARELFYEAVDVLSNTLGAHHSLTINTRVEQGRLMQLAGLLANAKSEYEQAVRSAEMTFGRNHHQFGIQLLSVGNVEFELEEFERARTAYANASDVLSSSLPENHVFRGAALVGLAMVDLEEGSVKGGLAYAERALEIFDKGIGHEHWYYHLAYCLTVLATFDEKFSAAEQEKLMFHFDGFRRARDARDFRVRFLESKRIFQNR
ncbi:MAG: protein kinase [Woeseiaceae bacterium]